MARKASGGTPATIALTRARIAFTLHPYAHAASATSFGEEAAAALGVDRSRIFKTLVVDCGGELVVAIVPVAKQLDLKAVAASAGAKRAVLADPSAAARATGYVLGGISPIGQRTLLRTFLDCLIAAAALRADATLVHRDTDFDRMSEIAPYLGVLRLPDD